GSSCRAVVEHLAPVGARAQPGAESWLVAAVFEGSGHCLRWLRPLGSIGAPSRHALALLRAKQSQDRVDAEASTTSANSPNARVFPRSYGTGGTVLYEAAMGKRVEQLESVVVRFAGDSGDGMQLTGGRFTSETALFGNDVATFPDFPAEIRAPAGSLPGVSGFQLHFADHDILTPGDQPDVLVVMNPAALKTNLLDLP